MQRRRSVKWKEMERGESDLSWDRTWTGNTPPNRAAAREQRDERWGCKDVNGLNIEWANRRPTSRAESRMKDEIRHWALEGEHAQVAAWQRKAGQTQVEDKGINDAHQREAGGKEDQGSKSENVRNATSSRPTHRTDPACLDSGFFKCPREYREYSRAQNRPSAVSSRWNAIRLKWDWGGKKQTQRGEWQVKNDAKPGFLSGKTRFDPHLLVSSLVCHRMNSVGEEVNLCWREFAHSTRLTNCVAIRMNMAAGWNDEGRDDEAPACLWKALERGLETRAVRWRAGNGASGYHLWCSHCRHCTNVPLLLISRVAEGKSAQRKRKHVKLRKFEPTKQQRDDGDGGKRTK